jgi:hypothetical protein
MMLAATNCPKLLFFPPFLYKSNRSLVHLNIVWLLFKSTEEYELYSLKSRPTEEYQEVWLQQIYTIIDSSCTVPRNGAPDFETEVWFT